VSATGETSRELELRKRPQQGDTLTERGATILARQVEEFWQLRGCRVRARVVTLKLGDSQIRCVRSDLLNGLPVEQHRGGPIRWSEDT
jgi:hypothetical protein